MSQIQIQANLKGNVETAHSEITATATSSVIDTRNYNSVFLFILITVAVKNWTIKLQGCDTRNGTYIDLYSNDANTHNAMSIQTNANKIVQFKNIPNWIKVVATEDEDTAKCTVKVLPFNQ
jgi:hypothetical protein